MSINPDPWLLTATLLAALVCVWAGRRRPHDASTWLRPVALVVLGCVALHPVVGAPPDDEPPPTADVVLVVDRTTSMGAQDLPGGQPRMHGVAQDIARIVDALPGARFTVVTADNEARVAAPWTTDRAAIETLARTMGWREEGFGTGSDVSVGVPVAERLLRSARPGAPRVLVYLGDGEQIASHPPASFAPLGELVDDALVLGYGTAEGGVMAKRTDTDELVTRDGQPQRSHIDEDRLRTIAAQLGGTYLHRTGEGPIAPLPVAQAAQAPVGDDGGGHPLDWWLGGVAASLVVADLGLTARRTRLAKEDA